MTLAIPTRREGARVLLATTALVLALLSCGNDDNGAALESDAATTSTSVETTRTPTTLIDPSKCMNSQVRPVPDPIGVTDPRELEVTTAVYDLFESERFVDLYREGVCVVGIGPVYDEASQDFVVEVMVPTGSAADPAFVAEIIDLPAEVRVREGDPKYS